MKIKRSIGSNETNCIEMRKLDDVGVKPEAYKLIKDLKEKVQKTTEVQT